MSNVVDIRSERNFELAMRLHTDVNNADNDFFTDLNGFQTIQRRHFDKLPLQVRVAAYHASSWCGHFPNSLKMHSLIPN